MPVVPAAAGGDDAKETPQPGFSYEVVSVEYEVREMEPASFRSHGLVVDNGGGTPVTVYGPWPVDLDFTSCFMSDTFPGGDFSACEVSVPTFAGSAEQVGVSSKSVPLSPQSEYRWQVEARADWDLEVPAETAASVTPIYDGYRITADFRMELKEKSTGNSVAVEGVWTGNLVWRSRLCCDFSDKGSIEVGMYFDWH